MDERKRKISDAIKSYTLGDSTLNQFRLQLAGVKIDGALERAIRRHEAGETVSYMTFGTLIFRQMNGSNEAYNRVDKINMNNPAQVAPVNAARPFQQQAQGQENGVPKRKKRITDNMQMEDEWRNSTGVYQQTRGGATRSNIFGSNLFNIINQEESRRTGADREWANSGKSKKVKFQSSDASLFGFDVGAGDQDRMSYASSSAFQ